MKNPSSRTKLTNLLAATYLALMPAALAVSPPPDGGYPNANTAEGENALLNLTTGSDNTAIGEQTLSSNTTGDFNTANGAYALLSLTAGSGNTANGAYALFGLITGSENTAIGDEALINALTGSNNTAIGSYALWSGDEGSDNTAIGANAMEGDGEYPLTGSENTAIGSLALTYDVFGSDNTAIGFDALYSNGDGNSNTANGAYALFDNQGSNNTASGRDALHSNTTGNYSTATGQASLYSNTTGRNNTANGQNAMRSNTIGSFNIALGDNAGFNLTTGSNNIDVGNKGVAGEANTIRIGKKGTQTTTIVAGISGTTVAGGVGVIIDTNGRLGTVVSSARFKDAIKPMAQASEGILALEPVTFRYKHELDPQGIPQFGLVAEQVEKVNPDLVARDEHGKPYTVRYEAVNAMLLNEFIKEHRKVEEQSAINQRQEATIARLEAALKVQAAQIQKVSDQLRTRVPAQRLVTND